MSNDASITLEITGPVAHLHISNPGKRNAFTWAMYDQLEQHALRLRAEPGVRVVVLRGNAQDGFAAGTEIDQFAQFTTARAGIDYERRTGEILRSLLEIPAPTIAAIEGAAAGAGLAVAASCDLVVAESNARFGAPIARTLGNCLPVAVVHRLRSRLGPAETMRMLLTAELIPAPTLAASGFVAAVTEPGALDSVLEPLVTRIAQLAPLTIRALKELNHRLDDVPLPDDSDLLELCYGSADFREGVQAFTEHRHPEWKGV